MSIRLNGRLLQTLIQEVGGVDEFLDAWTLSTLNGEEQPSKSTVYRWIKGQLPKNSSLLLRLASVLDVDPFALVTIADQNIVAATDQMVEIVQHGIETPAPLKLLREFFGRLKEWPPQAVAVSYFKRPWVVHEFSHDPSAGCNYNALLELRASKLIRDSRPQVFHFAFRHPQWFAGRWLHYGFVSRQGTSASLSHINGYTQQMTLAATQEPTPVKTWLGSAPATFRVASLHGFQLVNVTDERVRDDALLFPA